MRELLDTVREWQAQGAALGRAVVVRTFGSAPRPEGANLVVTGDGRLAGSVSGGCVEGAAYDEIQAARAAWISSYAAPSTQPPDTLPASRPSPVTTRFAPSGRGAEPNVRTTTARPSAAPCACHSRTVSSSSRIASPLRRSLSQRTRRRPVAGGRVGRRLGRRPDPRQHRADRS